MKWVISIAAKALISALFVRNKVYCVAGMRRSGNHACINWLSNALEERQVRFEASHMNKRFRVSQTGRTVFINEVNCISKMHYLKTLILKSATIFRAEHVIISAEDCPLNWTWSNFRIPMFGTRIAVRRALLNVITSRVAYLHTQAAHGIGASEMSVGDYFLSAVASYQDAQSQGWLVWDYDQWHKDAEYRRSFLSLLELKYDIEPAMSEDAGGSSFTGRMPLAQIPEERWKEFELPRAVCEQLMASEFAELFTSDEADFLRARAHETGATLASSAIDSKAPPL